MADRPDFVVLTRHRDLSGREWHIWFQRALFALLVGVVVAALANVFGQHPTTAVARSDAGSLQLYAPSHVRPGLLYEARFTIEARRELEKATLVLDGGWLEGFTLNTVEPSPLSEASDNGRLVFTLGHVPAGKKHVLYLQFQVNPTNVGTHSQDVVLLDGSERLAAIRRTVTVFP